MTLPTAKKTKKKFYNKFIYKVSLHLPGCSALRYYSLQDLFTIELQDFADDLYQYKFNSMKDFKLHQTDWLKLEQILSKIDKKQWMKRIEGNIVDFYTNDKDLYDSLCNNLSSNLVARFEPKKGYESKLLNSNKVIFVDKIPHDTYGFKVYLKPHLLTSREERESVISWFQTQVPNITFTASIAKWVMETTQNFDRRYIYVDTEQTLLMLKLRAPLLVGDVYNFVKTDK